MLLLKHGADPNALDDTGNGAMVYAAGHAYAAVAARLIRPASTSTAPTRTASRR